MKNKLISISIVFFTLSLLLLFCPTHYLKIETKIWKESSVNTNEFFKSRLQQSGESSGLYWQGQFLSVLRCLDILTLS